jgi:hypothetical protein
MYLKNVDEQELGQIRWAPEGRYSVRCVEATATASNSGNPMISTKWEIVGGEHAGVQYFDYFLTTAVNGAGFAKKKLRALLGDIVDSDVEIPDEQVAARLLGLETQADLGLKDAEKYKDKNNKGLGTVPVTVTINGQTVQATYNEGRTYYTPTGRSQVGQTAQQAPTQALPPGMPAGMPQPGQFAAAPVQAAPVYQQAPQAQPQFAQQGPVGFAPPGAPQFAPPGFAPQGYAAPQGQYAVPQGAPLQQPMQAPNGQFAQPGAAPWMQPQVQQAQPEAGATTGGKRGKKG